AGASTGNVVVTVNGLASNAAAFTVLIPPTLTSLSPTSGSVGNSVTLTGTNFGSSQGSSTVSFNGTTATATSWGSTSIVVTVPSGGASGNVTVTVNGWGSNAVAFGVVPVITGVTPTGGAPGVAVTVTGTGFGSTQGSSALTFNGSSATPTNWNV